MKAFTLEFKDKEIQHTPEAREWLSVAEDMLNEEIGADQEYAKAIKMLKEMDYYLAGE